MLDVKSELYSYKTKVDKELAKFFADKIKNLKNYPEFFIEFNNNLTEYTTRGGKRLRAALMYHTYKMFGGDQEREIIRISMFVELIQSWLLIHDDIMDHDEKRRNGDTFHMVYRQLAKKFNFENSEDFGNSMAILGGDLAVVYAMEIISKSKFEDASKSKLLEIVSELLSGVLFGQLQDVLLPNAKKFSESEILSIYNFKTAKYTYEKPILAGAILAHADTKDMKILSAFAKPAGIAFQIRDDILGMFGNEEQTGKSTSSDIKEGKRTLLISKTLEKADTKQSKLLKQYLGKPDITEEQIQIVRDIVRNCGALDYAINECERQVRTAQQILKKIQLQNTQGWNFLYSICEYMIVRDI